MKELITTLNVNEKNEVIEFKGLPLSDKIRICFAILLNKKIKFFHNNLYFNINTENPLASSNSEDKPEVQHA